MSIVDKRREETYKDARACLDKYGKCAIIRPPGFGKTGILTKFLTEYGNVLYLYPAEVVRDAVLSFYYGENVPEDRKIDNVQFMTYAKLVLLKRWEMKAMGPFDLIITDECHKLPFPHLGSGHPENDGLAKQRKMLRICPFRE